VHAEFFKEMSCKTTWKMKKEIESSYYVISMEKKVVRMRHEWNWLRTLSSGMFGINDVESLISAD
jgi:hypothetical protein